MAVRQSKIRKKYTFLTLVFAFHTIWYKYSILYKNISIFNNSILRKKHLSMLNDIYATSFLAPKWSVGISKLENSDVLVYG